MDKFNIDNVWTKYRKSNVIETNDQLLMMIDQVVSTIHNLESIYGFDKSLFVVNNLMAEYQQLVSIARLRGLDNYRCIS